MLVKEDTLEAVNDLVSQIIEGTTVKSIVVDNHTEVNMSYRGHNFTLRFIDTNISEIQLIERAHEYISKVYPN